MKRAKEVHNGTYNYSKISIKINKKPNYRI